MTPDWLDACRAAEYDYVRRQVIERSQHLRAQCDQLGYIYVEMGQGWVEGLAAAIKALDLCCDAEQHSS
jgi:hypothetical protein